MLWGCPHLTPEEPAHGRSLTSTWRHTGTWPCVTHPFPEQSPVARGVSDPGGLRSCLVGRAARAVCTLPSHQPEGSEQSRVQRPRAPSWEQSTRDAQHSHGTVFCLPWHLQRGF